MRNKFLLLLLALLIPVVLTGCYKKSISEEPLEGTNMVSNEPAPKKNKGQTGNPATLNCLAKEGEVKQYTSQIGYSFCQFADKSICEEWAFFNESCFVGECFAECKNKGTDQEGLYNSCDESLLELKKCE